MTKTAAMQPRLARPYGVEADEEATRRWIKEHAAPGAIMILEETHGGFWFYRPARIVAMRRSPQMKIEIEAEPQPYSGPVFLSSGKNARHPTGQSKLLPPTGGPLEAALSGWSWHHGSPTDVARIRRGGLNASLLEALRSPQPL